MALYVYGIVARNAPAPGGKGVRGARVSVVAGDEAAALVSEIEDGPVQLSREEMLVHARVLERALRRGTVLPMRFGIVMSGPEEIQERLLDEYGTELREQLVALDGKVEVRIRATYDEQSLLREVVRDVPEIASLRASLRGQSDDATYYARIRLGELVAGAVERRRERDAQAIIDALAQASLAVEPTSAAHERVVFQASFLVERDHLRRFDHVLDKVANGYGGWIRFKYTGPLPPHSFVRLAERV
jgi:Gas vesicle synthesis protein GvpL/GvpF